jgi:hypothetical protein
LGALQFRAFAGRCPGSPVERAAAPSQRNIVPARLSWVWF